MFNLDKIIKYLSEEVKHEGGILHIEHPSHRVFDGHKPAIHALNTLRGAATGQHPVSRKIDDKMSFQAVRRADGKVGVKYKGAGAQYNYSEEDIDRQHGHKPYLAEPMKHLLRHIGKVLPKRVGEWQGGFLSTPEQRVISGGMIRHTPNTITYSVPVNSPEGQKLKKSKLSLAIHSELKGPQRKATPISNFSEFKEHPDVHMMSTSVGAEQQALNPEDRAVVRQHTKQAADLMANHSWDHLVGHETTLRQYTNSLIDSGERMSTEGYKKFLEKYHQKRIDSVKTEKSKLQKAAERDSALAHVEKNKKAFDRSLQIHHHVQEATNALASGLAKTAHGGYIHHIGEQESEGEGFVARGLKLVNIKKFTAANRAKGALMKAAKQSKSHHLTLGRINPIHAGHAAVFNQVTQDAEKEGAGHTIVLTSTQDAKKNPLTPQQKLKHAKRAFPKANIALADKAKPTILHHAADLHKRGVENLTVHVGSDRVEAFKKLLNDYNGKEAAHGYYNFKNITVKPVGEERQEGGGGLSAASGTAMRKHAAAGNKKAFFKMAPPSMSDAHKEEMYNDVRSGMGVK